MSSVNTLKRTIQRVRQKEEAAPANPSNFEFIIPDQYRYNSNGELFLKFDSGPTESRILIFTTQQNLDFMSECDNWFCDGTFSVAPPIFAQLYTIHGVCYSNVIPSVYVLLPDKKEKTYRHMFEILKSLKSNLNPKSIMIDYERAALNAIETEFCETEVKGCFFHMSQCIWRHVQELGLQTTYRNDPEFSLRIRMLPALAFIPEADVIKCYNALLVTNYYTDNEDLLAPLLDYFENTWVGKLDRRGKRKPPKYSITLWNCFSRVIQDLATTNNAIEGWHNCFTSLINSMHPSIWRFIDALKKEESINRFKIEQYVGGNEPPKKKIYRDRAAKIKKICTNYNNNTNIEDYLRGIAYNFQLQI